MSMATNDLVSLLKDRSIARIQGGKKGDEVAEVFTPAQLEILQRLSKSIGSRPTLLKISKEEVEELQTALDLTPEALGRELALIGKQWAYPPISKFEVAAVGLTHSGAIYIGVNLEFRGLPLFYSVHGEQFLIARLKSEGEQLKVLTVNAPPCGHCRQFLKETHGEAELILHTYGRENEGENGNGDDQVKALMQAPNAEPVARPERTRPETYHGVHSILPLGFGPDDLLPPGPRLLHPDLSTFPETLTQFLGRDPNLKFVNAENEKDELAVKALEVAKTSFCPYSESPAGAALVLDDGFIATGAVIESAAFNPTLSSIHSALINCYAHNGRETWSRIKRVVLAEKKDANVSQKTIMDVLIGLLSPTAQRDVVHIL